MGYGNKDPKTIKIEHPDITELSSQMAQKMNKKDYVIYLDDLGVKKDGTTDDVTIIKSAISQLNALGGGKIIGSYGTYAIGSQLVLDYNTTLDLNGAVLKPIGTLNVADASFVRVRYAGNILKNIIFSTTTAQYGIEFGSTSSNNLEMGCKATSGNNNLVRTESDNIRPFLNRSLTLEAVSRGRIPNKKVRKVEYNVVATAGQYLSSIKLRNFPSSCDIVRFKVTDINGTPDFSTEILSKVSTAQYFYTRARASADVDVSNLDNYYKIERDDTLQIGIYNRKATDTAFKVEIWFTNEIYTALNKVWQYNSKEDFARPHRDSLAPNNVDVLPTTIQQVEYRFKNDLGTIHKLGVTPARKEGLISQYPNIILPTPAGQVQNQSDSSEIKFYLNYPASQAVVEKPTRLVFNLHKVPKEIKARLIVGWYSQSPDGQAAYLYSTPIAEKDVTIPVTASDDSPFVINVPLDPKGFQKGSTLEGDKSFNYLYFVLYQKDSTYAPFLFGEEYVFSTYIQKEQGL